MKIEKVSALQVIDSRGNPTVEAEVLVSGGFLGRAMVPSGASTGVHEAVELRDGDKGRYHGRGVLRAVENISTRINEALNGVDIFSQRRIDDILITLDGTKNKGNLGANATLAVSLACARAAADTLGVELYRYIGGMNGDMLPLPMMNILNGGAHAANNLDIQEFMVVPTGAENFESGLRMCAEVYAELKKLLSKRNLSTAVGDEGGFAPDLDSEEEAIEFILEAVEKSGYKAGEDIKIAIDAASSEWFGDGIYRLPKTGKEYSGEELSAYWEGLVDKYPIISIEDAAAEDDMETWKIISRALARRIQLVGDDLFVTNTERLRWGIEQKICNAILIKPNQIGTLTETIDAVKLAKSANYGTVISHRSGETEDTFIADLAVGLCAGQIKTGAPCRGERTAKYNRLLRIESEISG